MRARLSFEQNDSYMLGEETTKARPEMRPFLDWFFLLNGEPHPAICASCGRRSDQEYLDATFRPKKPLDLSITYDGYLIATAKARTVLQDISTNLDFRPIVGDQLFWLVPESIPAASVDEDQSGIRKNKFCENCGHHAEVLLGIELQPHPHAKELVFSSEPSDGIYRSDLQFGSNFGQAPRIFAGPTAAEALKNSSLTGVTVVTAED